MARKMETSKKLVYISDFVAICLSAAVIYGTFVTKKIYLRSHRLRSLQLQSAALRTVSIIGNRKTKTGTNMLSS